MIQLLFVDDEPVILNSMVANDWRSVGVEYVFKAASGLEAVELLGKTPIDIVVTDIRMPGMDGLQLCKHIQENFPRTKCILLSGYGEFDYAKQALQYGTVNYLLKPIKDEELMEEVARVKGLIEQEWEQVGSLERARHTLQAHLPMLRANLLSDLLAGMPLPEAELYARLSEYQLPFEAGTDCPLLLVRLDAGESAFGDSLLYEFAVHNIAVEILGNDYDVWSCKDSSGYLCFLLQHKLRRHMTDAAGHELEKLANELILKVSGFLKGQISVLTGAPGPFPGELPEQYRKALNEFRKVPRSERGVIVSAGEPRVQSRSLNSLYSPPGFQQLLEAGRWNDARAKLDDLFAEMSAKKLDTEEHIMEVVYTLMNAFLYIAHLQGKTLMEMTGGKAEAMAGPGKFARLEQVTEWADKALQSMEDSSEREFKDGKSQLISKIHRFIEDNIANDVSLQAIADHVDLHPVYLSSLYKQEMNENISDFIMRHRMEKASVLLRTTDIKIYELSSRLGFHNPPYFSKLFKHYYGVTPQDYRDRNLS